MDDIYIHHLILSHKMKLSNWQTNKPEAENGEDVLLGINCNEAAGVIFSGLEFSSSTCL